MLVDSCLNLHRVLRDLYASSQCQRNLIQWMWFCHWKSTLRKCYIHKRIFFQKLAKKSWLNQRHFLMNRVKDMQSLMKQLPQFSYLPFLRFDPYNVPNTALFHSLVNPLSNIIILRLKDLAHIIKCSAAILHRSSYHFDILRNRMKSTMPKCLVLFWSWHTGNGNLLFLGLGGIHSFLCT